MIPVHDLVPSALATVLRKAPLTPEKVAFAWSVAVGPAIDKATTVELQGTRLRVRAKGAPWRREVERSAGIIRSRLDVALGNGVVRSIEVELQ